MAWVWTGDEEDYDDDDDYTGDDDDYSGDDDDTEEVQITDPDLQGVLANAGFDVGRPVRIKLAGRGRVRARGRGRRRKPRVIAGPMARHGGHTKPSRIHVPKGSDKPIHEQPRQIFTREMLGLCPVTTAAAVAPGGAATATGQPQRPMYFREFIVPDSIAPNWLITDVRIGAETVFNFAGVISAESFSSRSPREVSWTSQLINPGTVVQIQVINIGALATFYSQFNGVSFQ